MVSAAGAADFMVEVKVEVQRGCVLVHQPRDAGVQALGVLDFGRTARLDAPAGPLSSQLLAMRPPRLECNPDTAYQLQVDGGQHGGIDEVRYLTSNQPAAQPIPYRLYQDPAWRQPLPVNVVQHARVPDGGSVALPLYARIDRLAQVPAVGRYTDLLKVTVTW
ncbi:spore coat U domain-containing protein [Pseudomonas rubra]|uniref:Spore coat U domain-containing protein n=1 Tax=Pseudomonas rubra TaxID=2942627 RepID=A0ABT5P3N8_9PSED|nr:spore coat U domain-containing protein [Pseudomonas rubra]MDD1012723.1 spore coat U domain-containing protein [Pseudomonas rubra]MDD1036693.1 spore coat U domain-containing protein [Pseudomonas rubra]MDD1156055.1 spore coat U domain-containing protein [Pseudomonas rubra]